MLWSMLQVNYKREEVTGDASPPLGRLRHQAEERNPVLHVWPLSAHNDLGPRVDGEGRVDPTSHRELVVCESRLRGRDFPVSLGGSVGPLVQPKVHRERQGEAVARAEDGWP